ncbi:glycosyltransferase family 2 protein [Candidatus Curtissbacteria bacterium]|nr:glycosyltransferase family 2 protein [Candidatus Curtissbacteria bacterium]
MDISVVIVSYNTEELLKDCLNSLKTALRKVKSEVFVVDNNSQDDTVASIKKDFPWVKLSVNSQNVGFSKANNQSLKKARGKYILVLNPDTQLMSETIGKMINFMENRQDVAVSTCRVELPNGQLDRDCRRHFPTPWRAFSHFSGLAKIFPKSKIFDQYYMGYQKDTQDHEIDSCEGAFMMVRRSAIKKVGYFDEDFFFYGEDLDWCWRFKEAGYKVMYTPSAKIIHYKGAASGMKSSSIHLTKATRASKIRAIKESTRAMELFYRKHYANIYPFFITWSAILAIKILAFFRLIRVKIQSLGLNPN